jgi:hypothetical protein
MKTIQLVHKESWTYSQEERKLAEETAERWKKSRLMVWMQEDTDSITVKSLELLEGEIKEGGDEE